MSIADELEKLADLRDKGAFTEEEFQGQKAKILNQIRASHAAKFSKNFADENNQPSKLNEFITDSSIDNDNSKVIDKFVDNILYIGFFVLIIFSTVFFYKKIIKKQSETSIENLSEKTYNSEYKSTITKAATKNNQEANTTESSNYDNNTGHYHFNGDVYDLKNESLSFSAHDAYDDSYRFDIQLSNGYMKISLVDGGVLEQILMDSLKKFNENCIGTIKDDRFEMINRLTNKKPQVQFTICQPINNFSLPSQSYAGVEYSFSTKKGDLYYKIHHDGRLSSIYRLKLK